MKTKKGALYSKTEYAGVLRRLLVMGIDFGVVAGFIWLLFSLPINLSDNAYFTLIFGFFYLYLIEMKRRVGSIGNLITLTKLVSIAGGRPSIFSMISRSAFWSLSWFLTIIDILWITGDPRKQMVRDKFTGIFVVNRKASPIAYGEIKYFNYMVGGFSLVLPEIVESEDVSSGTIEAPRSKTKGGS